MKAKKIKQSLNIASDGNHTDKPSYLIEREEVQDTPFVIVKVEDMYFGTMGKYAVTESYYEKEKVKEELEKITWNRLVQVVGILIENMK